MSRSICVIMVPLTLLCTQGMKLMPASIWSSMGSPLPWKYPCAAISTNRSRAWALGLQRHPWVAAAERLPNSPWGCALLERPAVVPESTLCRSGCNLNASAWQWQLIACASTYIDTVVCLSYLCSTTWCCVVLGRRDAHCLSYALGFVSVALLNIDLVTSIPFGTSGAVEFWMLLPSEN